MADILTSTRTLGIGIEYTKKDDGTKKTVYLKVPNPKTNLTEVQIKGAIEMLITGSTASDAVLKTPDDQYFTSKDAIVTAYTESVEKVEFDIGIKK